MLESRAVIGDTDMLQAMQQEALRLAGKALDNFEAVDSTEIARFIKKCIVGTDFGSFVTHHSGCFIYFGIGNLAVLLFNGGDGAAPHGAAGEKARLTAR
ncbi:hypothetical protein PVAP13_2NG532403 [Panicum virgatum]|uniref:Dynein light chain n=1 Tax=Panicum virgatum TaxID=38727 RepID=A0A8T0VZ72_PANVG|nr:hypothetical protein PVAP13_2NG532403 [Panicum virgatum]